MNLSATVANKKSTYNDILAGTKKTVQRKDTGFTIAPAYVWKWGAYKKVFAVFNYSETKLDGFDSATSSDVSLDVGVRF